MDQIVLLKRGGPALAGRESCASEELQATFSALLRLPAGAKAPEAGKCRPFRQAWPKPSEGPLEGLAPFEALQKGKCFPKLC